MKKFFSIVLIFISNIAICQTLVYYSSTSTMKKGKVEFDNKMYDAAIITSEQVIKTRIEKYNDGSDKYLIVLRGESSIYDAYCTRQTYNTIVQDRRYGYKKAYLIFVRKNNVWIHSDFEIYGLKKK